MTEKEVIQSLETCLCTGNCENCYTFDLDYGKCSLTLFENTVNLINRKNEEIKRWQKLAQYWEDEAKEAREDLFR